MKYEPKVHLNFRSGYRPKDSMLTVELPPGQSVFEPMEGFTFMVGPSKIRSTRGPGTFCGIDGKTKPVHLSVDAENYWRVEISGIVGDTLERLLTNQESPS